MYVNLKRQSGKIKQKHDDILLSILNPIERRSPAPSGGPMGPYFGNNMYGSHRPNQTWVFHPVLLCTLL